MYKLNIIQIDNAQRIQDSDLKTNDLIGGYIIDELLEANANILHDFNTHEFKENFTAVDYCDSDDDPAEQEYKLDSYFGYTEKHKKDKACFYFGKFESDEPLYPFFDLMDVAFNHVDRHNTFVIVDRYYVPLNEWYRHLEDLKRFSSDTLNLFRGETYDELFDRIFNGKSLQWAENFSELDQGINLHPNQKVPKLEDTSAIYLTAYSGDVKLPLKGRCLSLLLENNFHHHNLKIYFDNNLSSVELDMVQEFTILDIENKTGSSFISNELKPGVYELVKAVERNEIAHVVIVDKTDLSDSPEDQDTIIDYLSWCKAKVDIMNA